MDMMSVIFDNWISIIIIITIACFLIYLTTRLITMAILRVKEEFYEQRSKTKTSCACTRDKR